MSLLAAILVLGLMIFFHELGHFLFAKLGGICVVEFSLGMGPRLLSFVKGGTRYSLKLFPFGGSCMMLGEDEDLSGDGRAEQDAGQKAASLPASYAGISLPPGAKGVPFHETPVWTRFSVIAAGPVFNFILALVCAFFVISAVGYDPAEIYQVMPEYPAQEAGLQPGDRILRLNDKKIHIYRDVMIYTNFHQGETLQVEYERDGERYSTVIEPVYSEEKGGYLMGITGGVYRKPESLLTAVKYSVYEMEYWVGLTFKSLGMIVKRQVTADDIAGPVRMVSMIDTTVKESSEYGLRVVFIELMNLCVILSTNLGIMNLLPIPALDGGRLVFIFIEALRGKPVDPEKEGMVHMAGMAVLMAFMVFVLFNDIRNML